MIFRYTPPGLGGNLVATALACSLMIIGLTDASNRAPAQEPPVVSPPRAPP